MEGKGKIYLPGGKMYEGELKGDKMDGYGTLTSEDGKQYEGDFVNGVK